VEKTGPFPCTRSIEHRCKDYNEVIEQSKEQDDEIVEMPKQCQDNYQEISERRDRIEVLEKELKRVEEERKKAVEETGNTYWMLCEVEGEVRKKNEEIRKLETELEATKAQYKIGIERKEEWGEQKRRLIGDVKTPPSEMESKKPGNGKDADGESE
jgi:chromosome segregation ATPase